MCGFYLPCRWVSNAATFLTLVAHDQGLDREEGKEDRKERGKKSGGTTQISFNFFGQNISNEKKRLLRRNLSKVSFKLQILSQSKKSVLGHYTTEEELSASK